MRFVKFALGLGAIGLIFLFGFGYGRWYSTRPAAAKSGRTILYYVDSMHPWYRSDKPGVAPDCGMKLTPVYADGGAAPAEGERSARSKCCPPRQTRSMPCCRTALRSARRA